MNLSPFSLSVPAATESEFAGILGGVGPLASAEFLNTLYEVSNPATEQLRTRVLLLSDPSFPDRSTRLLSGESSVLVAHLERRLQILRTAGASPVVICCFTLHAVLPMVKPGLQANVISLVGAALEEMSAIPGRHLLLCTNGSRQLRLFQAHKLWNEVADRVVWPNHTDQQLLHQAIYGLKAASTDCGIDNLLQAFRRRYRADWLVAGCTELHMVTKRWSRSGEAALFIDPLLTIARAIACPQLSSKPTAAMCHST